MAGFLDKLLGKEDKESEPVSDGGSWTDHEVSVDITATGEQRQLQQQALENEQKPSADPSPQTPTAQTDATQTAAAEPVVSKTESPVPAQSKPAEKHSDTVELTVPVPTLPKTKPMEGKVSEPSQAKDPVEIADIDTMDLKMATDQTVSATDPLDEITDQIQKEIAAEKSRKEKKEQLEKLLEVTNQLKRPDWDEDFDV